MSAAPSAKSSLNDCIAGVSDNRPPELQTTNICGGDSGFAEDVGEATVAVVPGDPPLVKVRAITNYVRLSRDRSGWEGEVGTACRLASQLSRRYAALGYETQTLRIVTNPFGEYLDCGSLESASEGLAALKSLVEREGSGAGVRVRVAIGEARTAEELRLVPKMIAAYGDLCNVCVNVGADETTGLVDAEMCELAAGVVIELAALTERGEGNFNFTANFACPELIPYFPAGYLASGSPPSFAIGLEHPDLLLSVLRPMKLNDRTAAERGAAWAKAAIRLRDAMEAHIEPLVAQAREVSSETGVPFSGLDSSAAPSKEVASICSLFEALGVPHFGASGTVEAAAFLTRVFKSVRDVDLIGFSGLMLTCLEDVGMAAAAAAGQYDIRALLQYSCVCGIGLDCVPIPGDTPAAKIAALMRDTGTLAFRYKKPLTVRLFPCEGQGAGETTRFESDDLCNCTIFAVE